MLGHTDELGGIAEETGGIASFGVFDDFAGQGIGSGGSDGGNFKRFAARKHPSKLKLAGKADMLIDLIMVKPVILIKL